MEDREALRLALLPSRRSVFLAEDLAGLCVEEERVARLDFLAILGAPVL